MSRDGKESCDSCGVRVYERNMAVVEGKIDGVEKVYFVCQACEGYYDDAELLMRCYEQE